MKSIILVCALTVSLGCTTAQPPTSPGSAMLTQAASPCPLGVAGARVVVDDTEEGVMLTFSAVPARIDELRARAYDAASLHGPGQRLGKGHDGQHGGGGDHGLQPLQLPPSRGAVEDVDGGVRIKLTAADPHDIPALRAKIRERATAMMARCE